MAGGQHRQRSTTTSKAAIPPTAEPPGRAGPTNATGVTATSHTPTTPSRAQHARTSTRWTPTTPQPGQPVGLHGRQQRRQRLTIPAAPSACAATPGTSTIVLNWTDPSNTYNITGYHIYRSTDNATWGSVYGTASGATATTFTDNSPGNGTAYFYLVKAYDATGESTSGAGMTCEVATVIAYDGFNYSTGTLVGQNGGVGFNNAWTGNSTYDMVASGNQAYSANGHTLTTSGNKASITHSTTASRTLASNVAATTTRPSGPATDEHHRRPSQLQIGQSFTNNNFQFGGLLNGKLEMYLTAGGSSYECNTNVTCVNGTTYFIVVEMQYLSTGDIGSIWINPQPGVPRRRTRWRLRRLRSPPAHY